MKQKLKQLWMILTNPRIKYVNPKFNSTVDILKINDNCEYLSETLGISEERREELANLYESFVNNHKKNGEYSNFGAMAFVSKHCKHQNELAYICFKTGEVYGKISSLSIIPLGKINL